MAQKYEIFHEVGWDDDLQCPTYDKLTTVKNEQAALTFVHDLDNIGKYGDMFIRMKTQGEFKYYSEKGGMSGWSENKPT